MKNEIEMKEKQENSMMKVIHDLKNPFCSIIEMVNDGESSTSKIFTNITSEANDGLNMLENLKIQFKMSHEMEIAEEPQQVHIDELIDNLKQSHIKLANSNDDKIIIEHPNKIPSNLKIHSVLVKRVLNNCISNAIKHTIGGDITIKYEISKRSQNNDFIEINDNHETFENLYQLRFEVNDNGFGIDAENMNVIFNNKYSDQSGLNWDGTGLGLPICRNICKRLNSFIQYKSKLGEGSIFVFFQLIPNQNGQEIQQKNKTKTKIKKTSKIYDFDNFFNNEHFEHICFELITAEDNLGLLKSYKRQFDKQKINYKLFNNGLTCQNYLCRNKCDKCTKILFTDNQMPFKNGIELANDLVKLNQGIKIVMVSADDVANHNNIFDAIQQKPMNVQKFLHHYNMNMNNQQFD